MLKFDNAKVGDRVFSIQYGLGTIDRFGTVNDHKVFKVDFDNGDYEWYFKDGRVNIDDVNPTLFWNEFHIPTEEDDKKPFDLVNFLRESLKVKKFIKNEDNYYLIYHHKTERLEQQCNAYAELDGVCFNFISIAVMEKLNKEKITIDQLKQAYKILEWI